MTTTAHTTSTGAITWKACACSAIPAAASLSRPDQRRHHRLWTGPSARTHAGQLDISQLPEILHAQRRHAALSHHPDYWHADTAVNEATHAIHRALRASAWTPSQLQRLGQLDPGTSHQAAPAATPSWRYGGPGNPAVEIAIYPHIIRLAARTLRAHGVSRLPA